MDDMARMLSQVGLWRRASEHAVQRLAEGARRTSYGAGTLIVSEGEPADEFGVVLAGRVRVFHHAPDGRRLAFDDIRTSEPFGVPAALSRGRFPASVEAVEDTEVAWVGREALFALLAEEPDVARTIVADLAGRVVNLTGIAQALTLDVPSRLARHLFQRALAAGEPIEGGLRVDLGMSKGDLAEALGTVPETLSRALGRLREQGIISVDGKDVIVRDVGALARMGSGYEEG